MVLPRQHRLKGHRPFERLYRRGRRVNGPNLTVRWVQADPDLLPAGRHGETSLWRCGVVVSSKVSKKAVQRNRLRRAVHGHLVRSHLNPSSPVWILISFKPGSIARPQAQLLEECSMLLRKMGMFHDRLSQP